MTNDFAQISDVLTRTAEDLMKLIPTLEEPQAPMYAGTAAIIVMLMRDQIVQRQLDPGAIQAQWAGVTSTNPRATRTFWLTHLLAFANLNKTRLYQLQAVSENTLRHWLEDGKEWNNSSWRIATAAVILSGIQLSHGDVLAARYKRIVGLVFGLDEMEFHAFGPVEFAKLLQEAKTRPDRGRWNNRVEKEPKRRAIPLFPPVPPLEEGFVLSTTPATKPTSRLPRARDTKS